MTRIKINDISEDRKISTEELRAIMGGGIPSGMFEMGQMSMYHSAVGAMWQMDMTGYVPSQTDPAKLLR